MILLKNYDTGFRISIAPPQKGEGCILLLFLCFFNFVNNEFLNVIHYIIVKKNLGGYI